MLVEMMSPVFKEGEKERPPIRFKKGLNVILGTEDGENSIGKSSAMLAIDFVFGGSTYISSISYIERGYSDVVTKFQALGADIKKIYVPDRRAAKRA